MKQLFSALLLGLFPFVRYLGAVTLSTTGLTSENEMETQTSSAYVKPMTYINDNTTSYVKVTGMTSRHITEPQTSTYQVTTSNVKDAMTFSSADSHTTATTETQTTNVQANTTTNVMHATSFSTTDFSNGYITETQTSTPEFKITNILGTTSLKTELTTTVQVNYTKNATDSTSSTTELLTRNVTETQTPTAQVNTTTSVTDNTKSSTTEHLITDEIETQTPLVHINATTSITERTMPNTTENVAEITETQTPTIHVNATISVTDNTTSSTTAISTINVTEAQTHTIHINNTISLTDNTTSSTIGLSTRNGSEEQTPTIPVSFTISVTDNTTSSMFPLSTRTEAEAQTPTAPISATVSETDSTTSSTTAISTINVTEAQTPTFHVSATTGVSDNTRSSTIALTTRNETEAPTVNFSVTVSETESTMSSTTAISTRNITDAQSPTDYVNSTISVSDNTISSTSDFSTRNETEAQTPTVPVSATVSVTDSTTSSTTAISAINVTEAQTPTVNVNATKSMSDNTASSAFALSTRNETEAQTPTVPVSATVSVTDSTTSSTTAISTRNITDAQTPTVHVNATISVSDNTVSSTSDFSTRNVTEAQSPTVHVNATISVPESETPATVGNGMEITSPIVPATTTVMHITSISTTEFSNEYITGTQTATTEFEITNVMDNTSSTTDLSTRNVMETQTPTTSVTAYTAASSSEPLTTDETETQTPITVSSTTANVMETQTPTVHVHSTTTGTDSTISFTTELSTRSVSASSTPTYSSASNTTFPVSKITTSSTFETTAEESCIQSMDLQSPESFEDGQNTVFECYIYNRTCKSESGRFVWRRNGAQLPDISSRIHMQAVHNCTLSVGKLTFRPIYVRDTGNITCQAYVCDKVKEITVNYTVKPQPNITIYPLSVSIEEGSQTNLTCNVTNYFTLGSSFNIQWSKVMSNGGILKNYIIQNGTTFQASVLSVKEAGNYSCAPSTGCPSCTKYSSVTVYDKAAPSCEAESTTDPKIDWTVAAPDSIQIQKCPEGYTGDIWRECDGSGQWKAVNLFNCTNADIQDALDKIDEADTDKVEEVIDSVINTIKNVTRKTEAITSGDLYKSVDVLDKIIDFSNSTKTELTYETVESFGDVIDDMVSIDKKKHWEEVNQESNEGGASRLLETVNNFGKVIGNNLNCTTGCSRSISKSNIVINVTKSEPIEIVFKPEDQSNTKLEFPEKNFLGNDTVIFTTAFYRTIGSILPTDTSSNGTADSKVVSEVLSLSIEGSEKQNNLRNNITLTFSNKQENMTNPAIDCVFWNFDKISGGWDSNGCSYEQRNSTEKGFSCTCNHLTNFAILMSPTTVSISKYDVQRLQIISIIGCFLSIIGLFITVVIYARLWRYVKNERSIILINLCITLSIGYILFLAAVQRTNDEIPCTIITASLHYIFLVVFFLMLAEGIDIFIAVVIVFKTGSKFKWLLLMAYGIPLIIVGVTIGLTRTKGNYHSDQYCWLTIDDGVLFAFVGPVLFIILVNILVTATVLRAIYSTHGMKSKKIKEKARSGVRSICTLLPILGITWVFGFLALNNDLLIFQYLFAITNSLQGFFIFIFHCVLSQPIRKAIRKIVQRQDKYTYNTKESLLRLQRTKSSESNDEIKSSTDNKDDEYFSFKNKTEISSVLYPIPRISLQRTSAFSSINI